MMYSLSTYIMPCEYHAMLVLTLKYIVFVSTKCLLLHSLFLVILQLNVTFNLISQLNIWWIIFPAVMWCSVSE